MDFPINTRLKSAILNILSVIISFFCMAAVVITRNAVKSSLIFTLVILLIIGIYLVIMASLHDFLAEKEEENKDKRRTL